MRDTSHAGRGARRQAATRAKILDAAETLLASADPDAITMEEIARQAGVSRASVFSHFGTKDELIEAGAERLLALVTAGLDTAFTTAGSALERAMAAGVTFLDVIIERPVLSRYLTLRAVRASNSPVEARIDEQIEALRTVFEGLLREAVETGESVPFDPRLLSYFLFTSWAGVAALTLPSARGSLSPADVRASVSQALALLARGVQPESDAPAAP